VLQKLVDAIMAGKTHTGKKDQAALGAVSE
jgi:hypothetical protein